MDESSSDDKFQKDPIDLLYVEISRDLWNARVQVSYFGKVRERFSGYVSSVNLITKIANHFSGTTGAVGLISEVIPKFPTLGGLNVGMIVLSIAAMGSVAGQICTLRESHWITFANRATKNLERWIKFESRLRQLHDDYRAFHIETVDAHRALTAIRKSIADYASKDLLPHHIDQLRDEAEKECTERWEQVRKQDLDLMS